MTRPRKSQMRKVSIQKHSVVEIDETNLAMITPLESTVIDNSDTTLQQDDLYEDGEIKRFEKASNQRIEKEAKKRLSELADESSLNFTGQEFCDISGWEDSVFTRKINAHLRPNCIPMASANTFSRKHLPQISQHDLRERSISRSKQRYFSADKGFQKDITKRSIELDTLIPLLQQKQSEDISLTKTILDRERCITNIYKDTQYQHYFSDSVSKGNTCERNESVQNSCQERNQTTDENNCGSSRYRFSRFSHAQRIFAKQSRKYNQFQGVLDQDEKQRNKQDIDNLVNQQNVVNQTQKTNNIIAPSVNFMGNDDFKSIFGEILFKANLERGQMSISKIANNIPKPASSHLCLPQMKSNHSFSAKTNRSVNLETDKRSFQDDEQTSQSKCSTGVLTLANVLWSNRSIKSVLSERWQVQKDFQVTRKIEKVNLSQQQQLREFDIKNQKPQAYRTNKQQLRLWNLPLLGSVNGMELRCGGERSQTAKSQENKFQVRKAIEKNVDSQMKEVQQGTNYFQIKSKPPRNMSAKKGF